MACIFCSYEEPHAINTHICGDCVQRLLRSTSERIRHLKEQLLTGQIQDWQDIERLARETESIHEETREPDNKHRRHCIRSKTLRMARSPLRFKD